MKHLKIYEDFYKRNYNIGDIVMNFNSNNKIICVVVDNEPFQASNGIGSYFYNVFEVGNIFKNVKGKWVASLTFNKKDGIKGVRTEQLSKITDFEKNLIYNAFDKHKENLEIVKQKTGIDLLNSEKYKKWQFENNVNKYNL